MKNKVERWAFYGLTLSSALILNTAFANPNGPYAVGEVGLGLVTKSELSQLTPANSGSSVYLLPKLSSNAGLSERIAIGNYFSQPDSVTSMGVELAYNRFNQQQSNAGTTVFGQSAKAFQETSAWSTTFEGIASFDIFTATDFFVKLGLGYANITRTITLINGPVGIYPNNDDQGASGLGLAGGAGLQFALSQHVALRIEGDGLTGNKNLSYVQGLAGLVVGFQM